MQQGLDDDLYHRVAEYSEIGAFSKEEKLAAELAERFVFDHVALRSDEAFWQRMKSSFSDQQILDSVKDLEIQKLGISSISKLIAEKHQVSRRRVYQLIIENKR